MSTKLVPNKEASCHCEKCDQDVTFRYTERQFFADEFTEPIGTSVDRVTDYGRCALARQAQIPGRPVVGEIQDCPFYQALQKQH